MKASLSSLLETPPHPPPPPPPPSYTQLVETNPEFAKQLFDNLAVFREERDKAEVALETTFWEREEVRDVNLAEANSVMKKLEDLLLEKVRGGEGEGGECCEHGVWRG